MIIYDLLEKSLDVFVQLHQSNLYTKNSRQRVQHTKIVFCMQVPAKFDYSLLGWCVRVHEGNVVRKIEKSCLNITEHNAGNIHK